jgi:hypothetical protein
MRFVVIIFLALLLFACGDNAPRTPQKAETKPVEHVKIVQFYAAQPMIPKGMKGNLCYGVENAVRLELDPPAAEVYPAVSRCIEVSPDKSKRKTTFTLTAYGKDGSKETKTAEVTAGAAPPRLYDLSVNSVDIHRGEEVKVCFKVENAQRVKASPGTLDPAVNCVSDRPSKTTTYKITAFGGDRQVDSGTVTVKVH